MKALLDAALLPPGRSPAGVLALGIQSPDGRRVADAIWAPYGRGHGLEGYEIKVSRGDVAAELAEPMKCEPWRQHCTRWWLFVADPALVEGLHVPDQWGICAPPSGRRTRSLTVVRPAPKLKPIDTGPAWQRIHVWYAFRHADRTAQHVREIADLHTVIDRRDAEISRLRTAGDPTARRVDQLVTRINQRLTAEHLWFDDDDQKVDAIVETIIDRLAVEQYAKEQLATVTQLLDDLDVVLGGGRDARRKLRQRIQEIAARPPVAEPAGEVRQPANTA